MPEHAAADDHSENGCEENDPSTHDQPPGSQPTDDRRRSPRFSCGGHAEIICLPSTGVIVPGTIRDLSRHGCWLETSLPIDCGARAEIVVRVNSASFRALGQVRAMRGHSGSGLEFVHLSAHGKEMLEDLVGGLARLQALMSKLKSDRRAVDARLLGKELEDGSLEASVFREGFRFLRSIVPAEAAGAEQSEAKGANPGNEERMVVPVDLFG